MRFSLDSIRLQAGFAALGPPFVTPVAPAGIPSPELIAVSRPAAELLGLDADGLLDANGSSSPIAELLCGNRLLPGSQPVASVYAGHQFGIWAGRLGDGRALLLGECPAPPHASNAPNAPDAGEHPSPSSPPASLHDGSILSDIPGPGIAGWELQLKGSGQTPYSRGADGRAVLRSSIREFLCSEAMAALGIPTTRALAVTGSRLPVLRESIESAAIVMRMSPSFIRFGHFEHFSYSGQHQALRQLLDHVLARHYPTLVDHEEPAAALLHEVTQRTARLIAAWQSVGFTHGVLNTDNMSILGLTIDYGPFAFMDAFAFGHTPNHSDTQGRYAWGNQPYIGWWNCRALAAALQPLVRQPQALADALDAYQPAFERAMHERFRAKLGLGRTLPEDAAFIDDLLRTLERNQVDFTRFFRQLGAISSHSSPDTAVCQPEHELEALFQNPDDARLWLSRYRKRLQLDDPAARTPDETRQADRQRQQRMNAINPRYVLRTHLAETCIRSARYHFESTPSGDAAAEAFADTRKLLDVLARPFDDQPGNEAFAEAPPAWAESIQLSCSS